MFSGHAILEALLLILKLLYLILESLFSLFIPARKKSVAGEIVLITGSGSGIGRLMALKFAKLGATLVLWDINQEGNKETARLVRENGGVRVHDYTCDCSKKQDVYRVADQVKKEVGDVSILINNAGVVTGKRFLDCPDSLIEKTMEVNTMANIWTCKAFLPAMMAANHGHVVTIASAAGVVGTSGLTDYCASKFAAVGFLEALAAELRRLEKTGVKATIVCPYFITTGMFEGCKPKFRRLMAFLKPEYAAERIVTGILREEFYLVIPRAVSCLLTLKAVLPTKMINVIGDYIGFFSFMDTFVGREKKK